MVVELEAADAVSPPGGRSSVKRVPALESRTIRPAWPAADEVAA